jgi:hypothetical protein
MKDNFDKFYFWIKVLKVSAIIFIPYWIFGFETGLFVGITLACLLLSKISLTVQEMAKDLKEILKKKSKRNLPRKTLAKSKT